MKHSKLVLAYSGGLDTSYSLRKLSKEGYEVHAVSINTGGFSAPVIPWAIYFAPIAFA